eukprot:CAMPEP_0185728488 /NCGR_PEP_ID=MMETSP1171-20130828/3811_1 /TAXON_ID=374046 /ORGANISM="Helicotheca tamensis, Strain CCMP826" /LENGTH=154 /DNA_ID=CAMNT_0028397203 /DNA_START=35 /DNA_END=499 /DNA_ORIENTATION=-
MMPLLGPILLFAITLNTVEVAGMTKDEIGNEGKRPSKNQGKAPLPKKLRGLQSEENTCPELERTTLCVLIYEPVTCGVNNCDYDNECFAESVGFDTQFDCFPKTCPESTYSADDCGGLSDYNPVKCDAFCEYFNECVADGAGFDILTHCEPARI